MHSYFIKPLDLLLFGNPSPFNITERRYRRSEGILNPIAFYGSLRRLQKDVKILGLFAVEDGRKFLFPMPLDIARVNDSFVKAKLQRTDEKIIASLKDEYYLHFEDEKPERAEGWFIEDGNFERYLIEDDVFNLKARSPFLKETRAGIKINRETRTTEKGHLYFQDYLRLRENVSFYIRVDKEITTNTLLIGGESKAVLVEDSSTNIYFKPERVKQKIKETNHFKLILLTPTNKPCDIDGAKLIAKVVGRPYVYAGWLRDISSAKDTGFPSRLFKLIRPGAVFYYRIEAADKDNFIDKLFERFWLKASFFMPDFPFFESQDGINPLCLGLTIIGNVKKEV